MIVSAELCKLARPLPTLKGRNIRDKQNIEYELQKAPNLLPSAAISNIPK